MFSGNLYKAAILCLSMLAVSVVSAAAEQPDCGTIYSKLLAARNGPELAKYRTALVSGKEYLDKCGNDPDQEKQKIFVTKQIPPLTEKIKYLELVERFNSATQADNKDEIVASGKELLARDHPGSLDIMIVLASVGYNRAAAASPVDTMNEDTIRYARTVLEKMNAGAKSETYGAFKYRYKTDDCKDGAANASGWMNYTIGYILSARQKKTKDGLPYLYKATQNGCETKDDPEVYRMIAVWYIDEGKKVEATLNERLVTAKNEQTDETRALDALSNGYLDRAIDAYARAYKAANAKTEMPQASKDIYYKKLQDVYDARFDGKMDGFEELVAKVTKAPFPDPTSEVKPVPVPVTPVEPSPVKPDPAKPASSKKAKPAKAAPTKPRKK